MASKEPIDFKDPLWMMAWLDTALKKEKEKYEKVPVRPDLFPGHEVAQAWGYVVTGYFLVEESFKALLHLRKKEVPRKHSLTLLFGLFEPNDQDIIREYYTDYQAIMGNTGNHFPFETLDDFLANLDGNPEKKNDDSGSLDWRYFLIEKQKNEDMPKISIELLHEIVYGCIRIIESARRDAKDTFNPATRTRSWRLQWERRKKYEPWITVRMNSDGWDDLGDRLEILWGPDYRGRYDFLLFKKGKKGAGMGFSELPKNPSMPIVDKRQEIENFDIAEGYRSIGIIFPSSSPLG